MGELLNLQVREILKESEYLKFEEKKIVFNMEELSKFYEEAMKRNEEGIIIKLMYNPYESDSRKNWYKIKKGAEGTFKVAEYSVGTGKYKDCISRLRIVDDAGLLGAWVGSGVTLDDIEDFKNEIKGVDDDFHKTQSERDKEVLITHEMEAKAASLGTSLVLEEVKDSIDHSQTLLTTQRKTEERFNKANDQLNLAIVTTRSLEEALAVENEVYKKSQQELDSIELQFIELGLLNERQQTIDQLQVRVESVRTQLTELKIQKSNLEVAKRKAQNEWDSSRSERMKLEANLREWEETIGRLNAEIEDFQFKCKALALPIDASSEIIDRDRDLLTQDKEKLDAAIKMIQRYEWYIKVTTLESEREDLRGVISSIEKDMKEKTSKIEKFREVTNEAENWISALSESVNIAVRTKIDAHQPEIVRLFKAMIPCPYLFEKVTLKHEETGIRLGLRYRGQEKDAGEPRFFLSSAQANVLALSIFLSFAMDQNWSKLDTILLDDPVQHLDDLDAVAFLDNLRATALGKFGHRKQIVVSTCDKNLYLLMSYFLGLFDHVAFTKDARACPRIWHS